MKKDLTFSRSVKEELSAIRVRDSEVARAELAGITACRSSGNSTGGTFLVTSEPHLARRFLYLSKLIPGGSRENRVSLSRPSGSRKQPPRISVSVTVRSGLQEPDLSRRESRRAFLRGAFIARGSMSTPSSGSHLEIVFESRKQADRVSSLIRMEGLSPGVLKRRGEWVVYLKKGDEIVEFLKLVGACRGVMEYEDQRARRNLRGTVNRLVNMDGANLSRSVEASLRQIDEIRIIDELLGIDRLPAALREIARARLENPELTLEELGAALGRPVSKSAVNHRLRRLSKLAKHLLEMSEVRRM
ncbi:MAG TPA: DNA-binding protein WhiA [Firmicutes bacterium]|nr:DNA-binding protein WhiA [Candidatus Fermentithermobacillaceae bacterium]